MRDALTIAGPLAPVILPADTTPDARPVYESIERQAIAYGLRIAKSLPAIDVLRERAADPGNSPWLQGYNERHATACARDIRLLALNHIESDYRAMNRGDLVCFTRWYRRMLLEQTGAAA